jgi:Tfp pilus assembly protein PilF
LGRLDEALDSLRAALALRPDDTDALSNTAAVLSELDRHREALRCCDRALALAPGHLEALRSKARALQALNRPAEALPIHRAIFIAKPDATGALGVGNARQALGHYEEALAAADDALALEPELTDALVNRGNALRALGRHREALQCYALVIARHPDDVDAHWNEALTRLTLGDFERGWPMYEWRTRGLSDASDRLHPTIPVWRGNEEIAGKTILLHTEQGLGDAIQFIRYAPLVAQRGARVMAVCHRPLARLFRTVSGVEGVLPGDDVVDPAPAGSPAPEADYQALLMSLPLAFGTRLDTIPDDVPYVAADPERVEHWQARLVAQGARRNIGLAWRGNPEHPGARNRDCPAELLGPLLAVPDCAFFSLQLDEGAADLAALGSRNQTVVDLAGELGDFHETAAAICALDLVISVDTAVAHLAGALGRNAWLLLSFAADWRWLLDRDDSPWYPSLRLFRQQAPGDWRNLLGRVAEELARLDG